MSLKLGPLPAHLREPVTRWIEEGRLTSAMEIAESINARLLVGGPGGCCYLDAQGEVWDDFMDESGPIQMEDGPRKMSVIAVGCEHLPFLKDWLPSRPESAAVCKLCAGLGKLPPPFSSRIQCYECCGLGWDNSSTLRSATPAL